MYELDRVAFKKKILLNPYGLENFQKGKTVKISKSETLLDFQIVVICFFSASRVEASIFHPNF